MLALEEATLSTDLQQGYALKSLTGRLSLRVFPLGTLGIVWGLTFVLRAQRLTLFSLVLTQCLFKLCVFLFGGLTFLSTCSAWKLLWS